MRKLKLITSLVFVVIFALLTGCKKEELSFTLVSLTADGIDLAGVTTATNVPEDAVITATFSSDIDPATATAANFAITNTDGGNAPTYTVEPVGASVKITPTDQWDGGTQYTITLSSAIMGDNEVAYAGNVLTFRTSGIAIPQKDAQVLYLSFDEQTTADEAGDHTINLVGTMAYSEDRWGTANSSAYFTGQGNLVEVAASADLISPSITLSWWMKTDLADYDGGEATGQPQTRFVMGLGVEKGYFLEMGRRSNNPTAEGFNEIFLKFATNHVNIGDNAAAVPEATSWSEVNSQINVNYDPAQNMSGWSFGLSQLTEDPPNRAYIREQVMGKWTHVVMTHDANAQTKTIYINGVKWAAFQWVSSGAEWLFSDLSLKSENNDGTPMEGLEGSLAIGFAGSSDNKATGWADYDASLTNAAEQKKFFKGSLDQFRIFNIALSENEVQFLYNNEK